MEIRFATLDDVEQLIVMRWTDAKEQDSSLDESSYTVFHEEYNNYLFEIILSDEHYVWVAEDDGSLTGQMSLKVSRGFPYPDQEQNVYAVITSAYTTPQYRERKILESIMDAVKQFKVEEAITLLYVSSEICCESAFFEKAGFTYSSAFLTHIDDHSNED
ncbi:hypothetical protein JCM19037_3874 [Geomicrobium sp. JCM 19037]|uniref:GNAT family N-acetyltransferase n=1 Tax=unclassified Geomicrobium TaxID=2628951 RepID=UPI00045F363F|nr:GNAT family N-acetyltransferase [Geomicrobium sp. JCM 19037]GAK05378.1 hypothetical protein JCM19037_3874 [Geomicrobium sp. JCM 19037]